MPTASSTHSTWSWPAAWKRQTDVIDEIDAVSWVAGSGQPIVLIHGIGPGTAGIANFEPLMARLAACYQVHVIDLIGFGESGRKVSLPYFDVALWTKQIAAVLDRIGRPATLIGNSVGGALAFRVAAQYASMVSGVMAIGSPLCPASVTPALRRFWSAPATVGELAEAMQPMTAARTLPAPARVAARFAVFAAEPNYAAYFSEMLYDAPAALREIALTPDIASRIACPMTVIHGTMDSACLLDETALSFSKLRPDADVALFGNCGHNVTWERTDDLMGLLINFLRRTNMESLDG